MGTQPEAVPPQTYDTARSEAVIDRISACGWYGARRIWLARVGRHRCPYPLIRQQSSRTAPLLEAATPDKCAVDMVSDKQQRLLDHGNALEVDGMKLESEMDRWNSSATWTVPNPSVNFNGNLLLTRGATYYHVLNVHCSLFYTMYILMASFPL